MYVMHDVYLQFEVNGYQVKSQIDYIVITTKKAGKNGVRDEKTFMFTFNSSKKKSVENSIEKRILQQGTQLEDGTYTDGFNTYHEK